MEHATRREPLPRLMPVKEYAAWFEVHENTVRRWITEGAVPVVRVGRTIRIVRSADDAADE